VCTRDARFHCHCDTTHEWRTPAECLMPLTSSRQRDVWYHCAFERVEFHRLTDARGSQDAHHSQLHAPSMSITNSSINILFQSDVILCDRIHGSLSLVASGFLAASRAEPTSAAVRRSHTAGHATQAKTNAHENVSACAEEHTPPQTCSKVRRDATQHSGNAATRANSGFHVLAADACARVVRLQDEFESEENGG
jgi:septal ring-binding cell division protein DamX